MGYYFKLLLRLSQDYIQSVIAGLGKPPLAGIESALPRVFAMILNTTNNIFPKLAAFLTYGEAKRGELLTATIRDSATTSACFFACPPFQADRPVTEVAQG